MRNLLGAMAIAIPQKPIPTIYPHIRLHLRMGNGRTPINGSSHSACLLAYPHTRTLRCVCDHTHPVQFIDEGQCSNEILTESIQSLCLVEDSLSDNRLLS